MTTVFYESKYAPGSLLRTIVPSYSYSDGTPRVPAREDYMQIVDNALFSSGFIVKVSLESFMADLAFADHLSTYGKVALFVPFLPGARQDRSNAVSGGDALFTAKTYAKIINSINPQFVGFVDAHSDVMPSYIDNCGEFTPAKIISYAIEHNLMPGNYDGIIAPDKGAVVRAAEVAQILGLPLYKGFKVRDPKDGTLTGFGIDPIPNGKYLIVDDICDGGGTFLGLASILPDGAEADLYVSHGIFSNNQNYREMCGVFGNIITTDSLGQYHSNHITINLDDFILTRWNEDESV